MTKFEWFEVGRGEADRLLGKVGRESCVHAKRKSAPFKSEGCGTRDQSGAPTKTKASGLKGLSYSVGVGTCAEAGTWQLTPELQLRPTTKTCARGGLSGRGADVLGAEAQADDAGGDATKDGKVAE
jgi:hypothetical protein